MKIPYQNLSKDVLLAIIEEYVSREGTDYGDAHYSLSEKVAEVYKQLEAGKVVLVFREEFDAPHILTASQYSEYIAQA